VRSPGYFKIRVGQIIGKLFSKKPAADTATQTKAPDVHAMQCTAVLDGVSDGVAVINETGIIQIFNPAASTTTGWAQNDAKNLDFRSIFKFFDTDEHPITDEQNPIIIATKTGFPVERDDLLIETGSKKHVQISIKVTPILDKGQDPPASLGATIIFRNITLEQKERNEQADFISTASHEMRTPVAIIEGYLGMLLNPATATVDARGLEYATKAHEAAQHLGHLFQDLLDITRVDDHRIHTEFELVDASVVAEQVVAQFGQRAADNNLQLTYTNAIHDSDKNTIQPVHIIYVDLSQLNEILSNILDNAIKYTKQGGVTVSVDSIDGRVRFSIRDTGIGIPAEDVPHLFQKFYRVDNTDTREIGGTGLGLYLIKKLTDNLGGTVGVESDYGKGSLFWVEFNELTRDQAIQKAQEIQNRQNQQPGA